MGAGQIGGIATLLDIDFHNAAGFLGQPAPNNEAQFIVYYLSSTMLFCTGALLESFTAITPASCVHNEKYKFTIYGGTHQFRENKGTPRLVTDVCFHSGYNHSDWLTSCRTTDIALLVLDKEYNFRDTHERADYVMDSVWYGVSEYDVDAHLSPDNKHKIKCYSYGWGSRRNGFLVPTLINLYKFELKLQAPNKCEAIWNFNGRYLCFEQPGCLNLEYGAMCPDDYGAVVLCDDWLYGLMTSKLIDRPCGIGYLRLSAHKKFLHCAIEASRTVYMSTKADTMFATEKSKIVRIQGMYEHTATSSETITTPQGVTENEPKSVITGSLPTQSVKEESPKMESMTPESTSKGIDVDISLSKDDTK